MTRVSKPSQDKSVESVRTQLQEFIIKMGALLGKTMEENFTKQQQFMLVIIELFSPFVSKVEI